MSTDELTKKENLCLHFSSHENERVSNQTTTVYYLVICDQDKTKHMKHLILEMYPYNVVLYANYVNKTQLNIQSIKHVIFIHTTVNYMTTLYTYVCIYVYIV